MPKDVDTIKDFASIFRGRVVMVGKNGYLEYLRPLRNFLKETNHARNVSLWEREDGKEVIRHIAVEGKKGMHFEIEPTYEIEISKTKTQYIWGLNCGLNTGLAESIYMLAKVICYLHPDAKSLHKTDNAYICVPGIPCLTQSFTPSFKTKSGKRYSFNQLWEAFGSKIPVKGKSLKKFLRSEKVYKPGLTTFHEFLCLKRLNIVLSLRYKKAEFEERKSSILFLIWNFCHGLGMKRDEVMDLVRNFTKRRGYACADQEILDAQPVKDYRFTNAKLVEYLGEKAEKPFGMKKQKNKDKEGKFLYTRNDILLRVISELANKGYKIREMVSILGEHISKIKRLRSRAVKMGFIVKPKPI